MRNSRDLHQQNPKVSVVITCHNYGRYLRDAVESVVAQTYSDFEIIIVDDGSTDDTRDVAASLAAGYPGHGITVIGQENQGAAAARNNGIAAGKGEYIVSLDADDMLKPTFLEKTVGLLEKNPSVGIAYTSMELCGDVDGLSSTIVTCEEYDFTTLAERNILPSCNLFRREAWIKAGGYKRLIGAEDWELWISMGEAGYYGKLVPEPLFLHRLHGRSKYSITSRRKTDVSFEIRRLHIRLHYPALCRYSEGLAVAALYIRCYMRDPVAHFIFRKFPRLHSALRGTQETGFNNKRRQPICPR